MVRGRLVRLALVLLAVGLGLLPGCREGQAVSVPALPYGPSSCVVDLSYNFSTSAIDPDGDSVSIRYSWGDGETSDWSEWVYSDAWVTRNHSWSCPGTFKVTAQAKGRDSSVSAWSEPRWVVTSRVIATWARTYGGAAADQGNSVCEVPGSGYIITGQSASCGSGGLDAWLIRTDLNG